MAPSGPATGSIFTHAVGITSHGLTFKTQKEHYRLLGDLIRGGRRTGRHRVWVDCARLGLLRLLHAGPTADGRLLLLLLLLGLLL